VKALCKKNFSYNTKNDYSGFIPIKVDCFIKGELYEYIKDEKTISVNISGNMYIKFMINNRELDFTEYFYTNKEVRQLKLERLKSL
jgi:hypothetical protein